MFFFNVSYILKIERFPFPIQCVLQWSFISFLYVCRYRINRLCCRVIGMNEKIETIKIINCILNYEFHLFLLLFGISVIGSTIIILRAIQFNSRYFLLPNSNIFRYIFVQFYFIRYWTKFLIVWKVSKKVKRKK